MQRTAHHSKAEQTIIRIIRKLPPERVGELVNFARFLEFQIVSLSEWQQTETALATTTASPDYDAQWDQLLKQPEAKELMRTMAREAIADYHAGRTTDIAVTEDGKLTPA